MDSLSQLPVECLEGIIHYILSVPVYRKRYSLVTLATLCQVNKRICNITTRFLYQNMSWFFNMYDNYERKTRRSRHLLRTLISNIPPHNLHPAVILGLGIDSNYNDASNSNNDSSSPSASGFNHLFLIRCLDLLTAKYTDYDAQGNRRDYTTAELDYIHGQEFLDMYLTDRKDATSCRFTRVEDHLISYYPNVVYREAIWSLAEPIFEQLERLTFLLSDLRRYHDNVGRLKNLENLDVRFDLVLSCNCRTCTPEAELRRQRREETLGQLVQFVKDHMKLFPGLLKTVNLPNKVDYWEGYYQTYPGTVRDEIYRILPAVYKPDIINQSEWPKVLVHLSAIDLGHVSKIAWLPPGIDLQLFLQRCRGLREISVQTLARGCFDWAVSEKNEMEIFGQGQGQGLGRLAARSNSAPVITQAQHQDILSEIPLPPPQPAWSKHGLVKLQNVLLQNCKMPSQDLETITTAFNHSLRTIYIQDLQPADDAQTTHIHVGNDWPDMPLLDCLELRTRSRQYRVALDPRLFARHPSIQYAKIKDKTFNYPRQEIVPWLPADLPELRIMYLRGLSALSFNPTTLHSTKNLRDLKLGLKRLDWYCYIPPVDELDEAIEAKGGGGADERYGVLDSILRPRWSWNWHLPMLDTLDLSSEFAYRFEFQMLHGCPNLEILRLHMRTVEGLHTRVISEAHLFVSGVDGGSLERIVAPKLKKLSMNGRWVITDPSVLPQFLGSMFPKLERLVAIGWAGVTVGSFVKVIRTTAGHIKSVRTDLEEPSDEEVVESKLCRLRLYVGMKVKVILRTRLFCSGLGYVLYKD
ncbi:hypothetical protein BGZ95_002048 [Linnemannia exigua]|uniref:Uncharacterized protein n=1 Tax=Linnemannia exigua TaxID=604196 RepID=A0AAD4D625_9FUNG|nr:hypothetical protein BGZ95_002048 [Linnemannia exigua]